MISFVSGYIIKMVKTCFFLYFLRNLIYNVVIVHDISYNKWIFSGFFTVFFVADLFQNSINSRQKQCFNWKDKV